MAYNNGFPVNYAQYYPQSYPQQQQTTPQIQNGGFVPVTDEDMGRNCPVV